MLLLLVAIAGAELTPPTPWREPWIDPEDYPLAAISRGQEGATVIQLVISPRGKPERCEVVTSTGNAELDKASCWAAMYRAHFKPAASGGVPAFGVYRAIINFWMPDGSTKYLLSLAPDFQLTVKRLPENNSTPVIASVNILVDERGALKECRAATGEKQLRFADVGCGVIRSAWTSTPITVANGNAVSYVRALRVSFQAENTKK